MSLKDWMKRVDTAQLNEFAIGQVQIKPASQMLKPMGQPTTQPMGQQTVPPGQMAKDTQVITQGDKTLGTVANPQLAQQIKQSIGKGEMTLAGDQLGEDSDNTMPQQSSAPTMNEALAQILGNHPHEHKMCQEGWGMDNSLYEALCDHYFKEGRIPRKVWHSSAEDLRKHVEECYGQDTGLLNETGFDYDDEDTSPEAHRAYQQELKKSQYVPPSRGHSLSDIPRKPEGIDITGGYTGDKDLEETTELERMLKKSKDTDMFESKKMKKVVEATTTKGNSKFHKAEPGGYGRVEDEEETDDNGKKIKKAKKDEPAKGRGRPKKTDNTSGEDKKFDSKGLASFFGSKPPKDDKKGKVVKGKAQSHADNKKDDEELDESKLKGKQSKLDINKNGKLDKGDFAMLRGQKKKDPQMESWDKQLKGLLTEGLTVSTSVGQEGGQDSVSITANNEDAHKLLQILQNAGMGSGVPGHAVTATPAPAQVLPKASPSTVGSIANTDGAPSASAQKDIEGGGSSVPIMAMPRGMAFSVNSDDSEMPTEPGEFGTLDQEDVVSALSSEQGSSDDGGDSALAAIKKLMGQHGASEVSAPEATQPAAKETSDTAASAYDAEEVEESDDSEDESKVPPQFKKKKESDTEDDKAEDEEEEVKEGSGFAAPTANEIDKGRQMKESAQTCNECGDTMDALHECDAQLNEWANSPEGQSEDEQFATDMNFMTNVITAGLNGKKSTGQTTAPVIASQTNRQMSEVYNINVAEMMRKLANIK